jgi:uncharacterized membrane protein YfcA
MLDEIGAGVWKAVSKFLKIFSSIIRLFPSESGRLAIALFAGAILGSWLLGKTEIVFFACLLIYVIYQIFNLKKGSDLVRLEKSKFKETYNERRAIIRKQLSKNQKELTQDREKRISVPKLGTKKPDRYKS